MAELIALKKQRATIKTAFTRIYNFCHSSNATLDEVHARADKADELLAKYEQLQEYIDEQENQIDEEYRHTIEEVYFSIKAVYNQLKRSNNAQLNVTQPNSEIASAMQIVLQQQSSMSAMIERFTTSTPTTNTAEVQPRCELKIPPVQIPDFDGKFIEWVRFKDLFEGLVHNKVNLSNVEKLEYLHTKLKGDALLVIKHLKPSNDNYQIAWDLLKNKYHNIEKIKTSYFDLLLGQPAMKSSAIAEIRRFYSSINEGFNQLKSMEEGVEQWSGMLLYSIQKKLDSNTAALWFRHKNELNKVTFQDFLTFLEKRINELEDFQKNSSHNHNERTNNKIQFRTHASITQSCPVCTQNHLLFQCNKFKELNIESRRNVVQQNNICFNCLQPNHKAIDCKRSGCRKCGKKHNTLVHLEGYQVTTNQNDTISTDVQEKVTASVNVVQQGQSSYVILPTAIVMIQDIYKRFQPCRALLDSGSQCTLITEACVQRLGLKRKYDRTTFFGIGVGNGKQTKGKVEIQIKGQHAEPLLATEAFCLSRLTQNLPHYELNDCKLQYFNKLKLADPKYKNPNRIDILLGADLFSECCFQEKLAHPTGNPIAINTIFGWVIMGRTHTENINNQYISGHISINEDEQLKRFWQLEDVTTIKPHWTIDEEQAEEHYQKYTQRNSEGRYVVKLPFKNDMCNIGESKPIALKRLLAMENKCKGNQNLKMQYDAFMLEYLSLRHMKLASPNTNACYLPHHAIIKPSSTTTKLRVVFDASCKTTNGQSLNDNMLIGPTVQNDLVDIIFKFRKFKVAFVADIEKMYRQILVHEQDQPRQRILWRESTTGKIYEYDLTTITYGTSSAPFLATRTLNQIALDNTEDYAEASNAILQNFYVDDLICSTADTTTAIRLKDDICHILNNSGMNLRKWASNSQILLNTIPTENQALFSSNRTDVNVLGLKWNINTDCFEYLTAGFNLNREKPTKRQVLSTIAKIYDPLGWCSPVVIQLKIFMQKLWLRGLDWDHELKQDLKTQWIMHENSLRQLCKIKIPRWYNYSSECEAELHGFSDASELAYSAVIYIRIQNQSGDITTRLLAAKTRVAPVKQVSLPRLELCGAHLLSKLITKVQSALDIKDIPIYAWTDSTIVLAWLSDHPRRWKSFVANRTSQIIDVIPAKNWRHISSKENPADLATRGISSDELLTHMLWWHGPNLLLQSHSISNNVTEITATNLDERKPICNTITRDINMVERYSSLTRLVRIVAYMLRFKNNINNKNARITGFLNTSELKYALNVLIRQAQRTEFENEIQQLTKGKQLSSQNRLISLSPFIDDFGIMRVGGRLENANIPFNQKHPIIMSKQHQLTILIIHHYHHKYLHAGKRVLTYLLGLKYWIISAQRVIKSCISKCTTCTRYRAKPYEQKMANIPLQRLEQGVVFTNTGIDYAGPIQLKTWKGRGAKTHKAWIALFICLTIKAIHIELVSELSTEAFIAAFRRFVARRGKPRNIFSDNGTNFIGANNYLKELNEFLIKRSTQETMAKEAAYQEIQWHFSPPSAPHFGGLWEAGVKSIKHHLRRVLKNTITTFEEMNTVLCQIEALLNSRPLCKKFEDDINPLTPAHFLIMRPMQSVAEEDTSNYKDNYLTRWQFLQRLVQQFWKTWSVEYISQLQQRQKWRKQMENAKVNDIVLIKDDNVPPGKWSIGRIMEVHPGRDGLVRVATISTANGNLKRPVVKLCPLMSEC